MGLWLQSLGPVRFASLDAAALLSALLLHCTTRGSIPSGRPAVAVYFFTASFSQRGRHDARLECNAPMNTGPPR